MAEDAGSEEPRTDGTGPRPLTEPPSHPGMVDLLAGLSVAMVLVPQSMAYAELAGLPSHVGLFASALPPIVAPSSPRRPTCRPDRWPSLAC